MSEKQQLAKLRQISTLLLDSRLLTLNAAARAKQESEAQLTGLNRTPTPPEDLSGVALERVSLGYQRWADARRSELNMLLARQTVAWMEARDAAREAFGKKEALGGIATKLDLQRKKRG
jgi:hypothetical protein